MKSKVVFHIIFVVALAPLLSGCLCTYAVGKKSNERTADTFNPSGVYRKMDRSSFAMEGTRQNQNQTQVHAYVIMPQERRVYTNENLSLAEIKDLPMHIDTTTLDNSRSLPSGYLKVADFPTNDVHIEMVAHYPKAYYAILLPFALVVDAVGLPFEFWYMLTHSQHW